MCRVMSVCCLLSAVFSLNANSFSSGHNHLSENQNSMTPTKSVIIQDAAEVKKYSDDPNLTHVSGDSPQEEVDIVLKRSFRDNLLDNVDKESIERICNQ